MYRRRLVASTAVLFVAALGLAFTGCNLFTMPSDGGTGTLKMLITDKPYPFEHLQSATVTITEINVRLAHSDDDDDADNDNDDDNANENENENENENGDDNSVLANGDTVNANEDSGTTNDNDNGNDNEDDDEDDDDGGFVTIFQGEREFNLLELRNGQTDLLAETSIGAGQYDEMRLVVTGGTVVLMDGREFDLKVPSGSSSGIKLKFDFEVADGETTVLLLDVDLSRLFSAIPSGKIEDVSTITGFKFQPTVSMRLIDLLEAGSVSGTVQNADGDPVANAAVTAFDDDGNEVTSTATEADGTFVLFGLPTGTYRVEVSANGFEDAEQTDVAVTAESDTALGTVQLQAAAP